jgi:hypothetical protein
MIERWLQISCDNPDCAETDNSVLPDMTVAEFLRDLRPSWLRVGKKHACSARCATILRGRP